MVEDDAVAALAALAHGDRLKAFRLLVKAGPDGMPSGEVAEALAEELAQLAHWLGLERIVVAPRGDLSSSLASAVAKIA